jgi:hypothetical protein
MIDRKTGKKRGWVCAAAQFRSVIAEIVSLYGEEAGYAIIDIDGSLGAKWMYAMDELVKGMYTDDVKRVDGAHRLLREYVTERKSTKKGRKSNRK